MSAKYQVFYTNFNNANLCVTDNVDERNPYTQDTPIDFGTDPNDSSRQVCLIKFTIDNSNPDSATRIQLYRMKEKALKDSATWTQTSVLTFSVVLGLLAV